MDQTTIVRSQFSREEVLDALRSKHPWMPVNDAIRLEASSASVKDGVINNVREIVVEYAKVVAMLALFVRGFAGCAAPSAAWVAGGHRSAEVGALAPVLGGVSVEASVERRAHDESAIFGGRARPAGLLGGRPDLGEGSSDEHGEVDYLGRLGLRYAPLKWAHLSAGLTEELGAFARFGLSQRITDNCSIGVDLLEDRGEVVLFGLTWSR